MRFRICIKGKAYNISLHRAVAETFIPNPENKPEVNHKDGNKEHNYVSNLEWTTRKENADHAYISGLYGKNEDFSKSTISNNTCRKICKLLQNTDITINDIALKVGCNKKIVYDIFNKLTWKEISDEYDFSHRKKLTRIKENDAIAICKLLAKGKSSKYISEKLGYKIHVIKDIKRGKTWKAIYKKYLK